MQNPGGSRTECTTKHNACMLHATRVSVRSQSHTFRQRSVPSVRESIGVVAVSICPSASSPAAPASTSTSAAWSAATTPRVTTGLPIVITITVALLFALTVTVPHAVSIPVAFTVPIAVSISVRRTITFPQRRPRPGAVIVVYVHPSASLIWLAVDGSTGITRAAAGLGGIGSG